MVLKPLDVKTKFCNAENDDVYLEAQVQNITATPICLEKVELDASHLFNGMCHIHFSFKLKLSFMPYGTLWNDKIFRPLF